MAYFSEYCDFGDYFFSNKMKYGLFLKIKISMSLKNLNLENFITKSYVQKKHMQ